MSRGAGGGGSNWKTRSLESSLRETKCSLETQREMVSAQKMIIDHLQAENTRITHEWGSALTKLELAIEDIGSVAKALEAVEKRGFGYYTDYEQEPGFPARQALTLLKNKGYI